jgi:hypothetical protein
MTRALQQRSILTMGLSSNLLSSPTKRCKTFAFKRIIPTSSSKATKFSQQWSLNGELVHRVDQGTLNCTKCEKKRLRKEYHKPHHPTCSHRNHYNGVGPTYSAHTGKVEITAKTNIANNTRKLEAHQKESKEIQLKQATVPPYLVLSGLLPVLPLLPVLETSQMIRMNKQVKRTIMILVCAPCPNPCYNLKYGSTSNHASPPDQLLQTSTLPWPRPSWNICLNLFQKGPILIPT